MKKYFVTGLVLLMPVVLTMIIIAFLFNLLTAPFVKIVEPFLIRISFPLPLKLVVFISQIFSLVLLICFIFLLGTVIRWFLGRHLLALTDRILYRIPLIRTIYKISREIIVALFSNDEKKAFKHPVLAPFPAKPTFSLGFQAGEVAKECQEKVSTPLVSVFIPTAPHPMSGFLFLMPKDDVYRLDMSNEDAVKFLVSCGLIHSDGKHQKMDHLHDL